MAITQLATQVYLDGLSRLGLDGADIARRVDLPTRAAHVDERALAAVWDEALRRRQRAPGAAAQGLGAAALTRRRTPARAARGGAGAGRAAERRPRRGGARARARAARAAADAGRGSAGARAEPAQPAAAAAR